MSAATATNAALSERKHLIGTHDFVTQMRVAGYFFLRFMPIYSMPDLSLALQTMWLEALSRSVVDLDNSVPKHIKESATYAQLLLDFRQHINFFQPATVAGNHPLALRQFNQQVVQPLVRNLIKIYTDAQANTPMSEVTVDVTVASPQFKAIDTALQHVQSKCMSLVSIALELFKLVATMQLQCSKHEITAPILYDSVLIGGALQPHLPDLVLTGEDTQMRGLGPLGILTYVPVLDYLFEKLLHPQKWQELTALPVRTPDTVKPADYKYTVSTSQTHLRIEVLTLLTQETYHKFFCATAPEAHPLASWPPEFVPYGPKTTPVVTERDYFVSVQGVDYSLGFVCPRAYRALQLLLAPEFAFKRFYIKQREHVLAILQRLFTSATSHLATLQQKPGTDSAIKIKQQESGIERIRKMINNWEKSDHLWNKILASPQINVNESLRCTLAAMPALQYLATRPPPPPPTTDNSITEEIVSNNNTHSFNEDDFSCLGLEDTMHAPAAATATTATTNSLEVVSNLSGETLKALSTSLHQLQTNEAVVPAPDARLRLPVIEAAAAVPETETTSNPTTLPDTPVQEEDIVIVAATGSVAPDSSELPDRSDTPPLKMKKSSSSKQKASKKDSRSNAGSKAAAATKQVKHDDDDAVNDEEEPNSPIDVEEEEPVAEKPASKKKGKFTATKRPGGRKRTSVVEEPEPEVEAPPPSKVNAPVATTNKKTSKAASKAVSVAAPETPTPDDVMEVDAPVAKPPKSKKDRSDRNTAAVTTTTNDTTAADATLDSNAVAKTTSSKSKKTNATPSEPSPSATITAAPIATTTTAAAVAVMNPSEFILQCLNGLEDALLTIVENVRSKRRALEEHEDAPKSKRTRLNTHNDDE